MTEPATHVPEAAGGTSTVDAAVRVVDLVKDFGSDVHAIGGVSFDVPRGELERAMNEHFGFRRVAIRGGGPGGRMSKAVLPAGFDPQLAEARPHEQFRSPEEWEGAMKLAEYWLNRLGAPDKEYVFTLLAPLALDRRQGFDFRERL